MIGSRISIVIAAVAVLAQPLTASAQAPNGDAALSAETGKDLVEGLCTGCHQTNMITRSSGYSQAGWTELIGTMIDLSGDPATHDAVTQYLAAQFPPNAARTPTLVPPETPLTFKEWQVPTLGQRARDPVEAPNGSLWWVGQFGNVMGNLDPRTGTIREYPLPPKAHPHSVTIDRDGTPWYTGNGNGTIGKLDPATGEITVYPMPDAAARDPHTAEFDGHGNLWFTLQQSDMIGRLNPATGAIRLAKTPPRSRPYGIKIDRDGTPWVACNGSGCLLKIDPETMALTEIKLPTPGTTVRRLDIADDGIIWYVNSSQGRLGRFDPSTGVAREWPSPSGPKSHPYALAVVDGVVWYNESGMRPDVLVRFDPQTERFESWPIPSGGVYAGIVRHMRPTREGNLLIHQSSTNRIILVSLKSTAAKR